MQAIGALLIKILAPVLAKVGGAAGWLLRLLAPYVIDLILKLIADYKSKKQIEKDNKAAIERARDEDDQRSIEKQVGSTTVGKPSGTPGAVVVDSLPGVHIEGRVEGKHLAE